VLYGWPGEENNRNAFTSKQLQRAGELHVKSNKAPHNGTTDREKRNTQREARLGVAVG